MADNLAILLTVEAVDKATSIIDKIGAAMDSMSGKLLAASQRATMSATDLEAAQTRAAASSTAYERALSAQAEAQLGLKTSTESLTLAQDAQAAAVGQGAAAQAAAAKVVEEASVQQVAALDALRAAEDETIVRAKESALAQEGLSTSLIKGETALKAAAVAGAALAVGAAAVGTESVKAAGDFQAGMLKMYTSAGEAKGEIQDLSQKTLQMSVDVATSTDELGKGLYFVESAGYHANDAMTILRAGAEGARAEGADLAEVTNALTTAMKDYGYNVTDATKVTDMMVTAVGEGKMTMQQFSSSLSTVLPTAKSAGISFEEVAGAIATMTAQGISAQQSTTDLNHVIQKLVGPTADSIKYMAQLGLDAQDLQTHLGDRGLTGTFQIITQAIIDHTHGNKVLVDSFNQSKTAAQDLNLMLQGMPPSLRHMSEELQNGSMSFAQYRKDTQALDGPQHAMAQQFMNLSSQADGFNQMIKSGAPAALDYTAALKKVVGDSTSLQSILALTNGGLGTFKANVNGVADAATTAGDHVKGWSDIQDTFNFKMDKLHESIHAIMIAIGTGLLPIVSEIVTKISALLLPVVTWIEHHQKLAAIIVITVGVLGTLLAIITTTILIAGALAAAIEAVGAAMGTILAATGVGILLLALGAAALYVATHWKQTKEVLAEVWKWITDQARAVADFFVGVWHDVVRIWDEVWNSISGIVKKWWPLILAPVTGGLSLIVGLIVKYRKDIGDAFGAVWDWLVSIWNDTGGKLISAIAQGWDSAYNSVVTEWGHINSKLAEIWGELVTLWMVTGGALVDFISRHWKLITTITMGTWNAIWTDIKQIWDLIWSYISIVLTTIEDILKLAWDVIVANVKVTWDLIWGIISGALELIWGVIKAAFELIWAIIKVAWDTIVLVFEVAWDLIKGIVNTALDLISGVIKIFIDFFTGNWGKLWHDAWNTLSTVLGDIWDMIKAVFGDIWRWLGNIMNDILNGIVGAWDSIWNGIKGFLSAIWDGIKSAFKDGLDALGGIWGDLKRLAADPVNFVIDTVYNNGIRTLWNDVSGVFGGPQLGAIGRISFASGGRVPGVGNTDSVPAMLMPGEFVLSHRMIEAMGGLGNVVAAFGSGSNDGYFFRGGGLVSGLFEGVKDAYNWGDDLALGGLRDAADKAFGVVNELLGNIPGVNTGIGDELVRGVRTMENGVLQFLGAKDKTAPKGVGDPLDTWVRQALAVTGAPIGWFRGLETIAMHESGGDPDAINNWDINAQMGDPSRGLMQTIMATFRSSHQDGTSDNIFDPVANVAAAINYIRSRYGDINNVPGIRSMAGGGQYVGYEAGTMDTGPFAHMALIHPREAILPSGVAAGLRAGAGGNVFIADLRGAQISSRKEADNLIRRLEKEVATKFLPGGGVRINY